MCGWCSFKLIQSYEMEVGSKRWFLPFWQFPGLLAKLLLTPAISTERPLIFISNVFFSSYVHIHCSVKTFKTSFQNDFKLHFSLFWSFLKDVIQLSLEVAVELDPELTNQGILVARPSSLLLRRSQP